MLAFSRKVGERIQVPRCELAVTVLAIEGKTVRLGISAPVELVVYREEDWQQLCLEQRNLPPRGNGMLNEIGMIDQGIPRGSPSQSPAFLRSTKRPDRKQFANGAPLPDSR